MPSVLDVAAYILKKQGKMSAMKLQKLVYYSQAWSLVWDEQPLFDEKIRAWANGPVVRELYDQHQGRFEVSRISEGNPRKLNADQRDTVDSVLEFYGKRSGQWLSQLTHREAPWREAREGLEDGDRSNRVIPLSSMEEYYGGLV
jgi:uncharacterized phage-associated protein